MLKWTSAVGGPSALSGAALLLIGLSGFDGKVPNVSSIVERWTAANRADFDAAQQYSYFERVRNADGLKTYEVMMLFGTPYKRVVEDDGHPLTPDERRQQDEELEKTRRDRADEPPDERAHRIAEYQKTRERAHRILEEMPRAFEYTLGSTQQVDSRTVYVLEATPRGGYEPPNVEAQVLTGMRGEFWIDTETYQLFHGWARVLRPVSIEGFLAIVQPGTEFEVGQRPVGGGIWLPTHFAIHSRSSIIFLLHHRTSEDRTYFNYRRISSYGNDDRR